MQDGIHLKGKQQDLCTEQTAMVFFLISPNSFFVCQQQQSAL